MKRTYRGLLNPLLYIPFFMLVESSYAWGQTIYKSSLKSTANAIPVFEQLFFLNSKTGWVVGDGGIIRKTTTGGETWIEKNSTTNNNLYDVYFVNENVGWICGQGGIILKTTDGGTTWASQESGVGMVLASVHFVDADHGWITGEVGVILSTTNGGTVWTIQNSGTNARMTHISFIDTSNGWAVGSGGIVVHTSNGGSSWTSQISNTTDMLWSVDFTDAMHGWAVGGYWDDNSSILLKTTNGGDSWLPQQPSYYPLFNVDFIDADTGWIVGRFGTILKTTNGGDSWINQGVDGYWFDLVSFINSNIGWVMEPHGVLLNTTDGGNAWNLQNPNNIAGSNAPLRIISIIDIPNDQGKKVSVTWRTFEEDSTIPFTVLQYNVWRIDLANVWTHVWEVPSRKDSILRVDVPTLFDSTKTSGMYWSKFQVTAHGADPLQVAYSPIDSGYSLDNLAPNPPLIIRYRIIGSNVMLTWNQSTDEDLRYYAIYRATQNGFDPRGTTPYKTTIDTTFTDEGAVSNQPYYYRISAFDFSGNESVLSPQISILTGLELKVDLPKEFFLYRNYPNPFNPSTNISYDLPKQSSVTIAIFDFLGRRIAFLAHGQRSAGRYTDVWNGRDNENKPVASGTYLVRFIATPSDGSEPFSAFGKFVLAK